MKYDRTSCGGVVIKNDDTGNIQILLLHRNKSDNWKYDSWHLPKGMKKSGESNEETALREIYEETGYKVSILKFLISLESFYDNNKTKITHYFLCTPIEKQTEHDKEHDEVTWKNIQEAKILLAEFPLWEKEEDVLEII